VDTELKTMLAGHGAILKVVEKTLRQQSDVLTILSRQVAELQRLLSPEAFEGESSLEQLLATLAAQGRDSLALLNRLANLMQRVEDRLDPGRPKPRPNGGSGEQRLS
jgi:hypothetical protein